MKQAPKAMQDFLLQERDAMEQLTFTLAQIPAPSHQEEKKAAFCWQYLEEAGASGVYQDAVGNLIWPYACDDFEQVAVFMAHLDTVFPAGTPLPLRVEGDIAACPGIWDDSANDAVLLTIAKFVAQTKPKTSCGLLFVWDVCEEAPGGLAGVRQLVADWGAHMQSLVSFDGSATEIISGAMGSKDFRITLATAGGHPTIHAGNANAVEQAARLISQVYDVPLPQLGRSARNAYQITGGESVSTIAQQAVVGYEIRSDEQASLAEMEQRLRAAIAAVQPACDKLLLEQIAEIPCATVEKTRQRALVERLREAILLATGERLPDRPGSTDCNVPLACGIPAAAYCCVHGENAHTVEEFLYRSTLPAGALAAATLIASYFLAKEEES